MNTSKITSAEWERDYICISITNPKYCLNYNSVWAIDSTVVPKYEIINKYIN